MSTRLVERGGSATTYGDATIVCGPRGERIRPISRSTRVDDDHAVFPATPGALVITAGYRRRDRQSMSVSSDGEALHTWSPDAGWDTEPPDYLSAT